MRIPTALLLALGVHGLLGCGPGDVVEIDGRRTSERPTLPVRPNATVTDRLPLTQRPVQGAAGQGAAGPAQEVPDPARGSAPSAAQLAELFEYEVPEGWEQLPPTQFRIVNLRLGAEPPAEITLVMLMGDGGGVRANVDRWRRQVGLAPMSDEEFLALEDRTLFDNPAKYVELRGSYEGMDGTRIADAGLYGAIFARNQSALFVKMTGPADVLADQRDAFHGFLDSLVLADPQTPARSSSLRWDTPAGWAEEQASSQFREVTFRKGDVEMYVSVARGGVLANVNRWAGQLGLEPMDQAGLDALPTTPMMGMTATVFEGVGSLRGMRDPAPKPDQRMLAAIVEDGGMIVTLKATGPSAAVSEIRDDFLGLAASIGPR